MNTQGTLAQKTAVRFAKIGQAIYHSHHDMIRFWERAVKRAGLPMRLTQGFNPRPRMVFPHALGLGIASRHEEVELELCAPVEKADLLGRLRDAVEPTLTILEVLNLPAIKKSRQITASSYRLSGWGDAVAALPAATESLFAAAELPLRRGGKGKERMVDIRPYLLAMRIEPQDKTLDLEIAHTATGSARPDEALSLLAEHVGVATTAITIEKTGMVLE